MGLSCNGCGSESVFCQYYNIDVSSRTCFLVGNEGHGLDKELISACSGSVIIPMQNGSESLNAAAASAILMWESAKKHGFND